MKNKLRVLAYDFRSLVWPVVVVVLAASIMITIGCHRKITVTNLPPGVTQQQVLDWYTSTGALKVIADTTSAATTGIVQANKTGAFPDGPAYVATITALGRMSQAGLHAKSVLEKTPNNFGASARVHISGDVQLLVTELEVINTEGLSGIKNPNTKVVVQAWLATLNTAITIENALVTATH